ncbi:NADP-dependent oxidoreductase [Streptomyces sp. NPDC003300]|uniref:NADP-dependent oxidoreductase n=1 Tax=unclassified Streptomyces TaxID=2593676 RepID=UPI0033A22B3F
MTKSIAFTEYGSADVLRAVDTDVPEPGPGQVRITVRTAGVNPLDSKIRAGYMEQVFPVDFPHVPGLEAAGVVEALGEGVEGLAVGDDVFGQTATGAYAERALAEVAKVALKPGTLSWEQAAALPVAAETAYRALDMLKVRPGETLLIHGAAGGVGTVAVQFAVARGVKVVGTASEANHEHLRALGAVPVAYGDGLVERVRVAAPEGIDAALDAAGRGDALQASVELTGGTERVLSIADAPGAGKLGVRFTSGAEGYYGEPAFAEALALFAADKLTIAVHEVFPLEAAADAQRASEAGHLTGKIVLKVSEGV